MQRKIGHRRLAGKWDLQISNALPWQGFMHLRSSIMQTGKTQTFHISSSQKEWSRQKLNGTYPLYIRDNQCYSRGDSRATKRLDFHEVVWEGSRPRRGGGGVGWSGDACVAQRARTSAYRRVTLPPRATQASPLHPAPPPPL